MPFKAAISTWTFYNLDLTSSLEALARVGFEQVEIWAEGRHLDPRVANPSQVKVAKVLCNKLGIEPISLHAPFEGDANIGNFDERGRKEAVEVVGETIRYAREVGAKFLVLHPGSWVGSDDFSEHEAFKRAVLSSLLELTELAEKLKVRLLVENMVPTGKKFRLGAEASDLMQICQCVPGLGICFDLGHANIGGGDPVAELRTFGRLIRSLHLNDNDERGDLHLLPGRGTINWAEVRKALEAIGYKAPFLLEIHGGEGPAEVAKEALKWLQGWSS